MSKTLRPRIQINVLKKPWNYLHQDSQSRNGVWPLVADACTIRHDYVYDV